MKASITTTGGGGGSDFGVSEMGVAMVITEGSVSRGAV